MKDTILISAHVPISLDRQARLAAARLAISKSELFRRALAREIALLENPQSQTGREMGHEHVAA